MAALLDGWESDFDGGRWFYRYKATGMIQYHFPQPGDEFAQYLVDAGTGPLELTPEESLAIEQTKRRSISEGEYDTKSGSKTSGSKREKKRIGAIEEEEGMSATGYFDPSSFMYSYNDISPVGDDDGDDSAFSASNKKVKEGIHNIPPGFTPEPTPPIPKSEPILNQPTGHAELPEGGQQMWSPVGFVAELATQETVKCAEELAPIELDATPFTPASIQTNIAQEPTELPTHRTPVEEKAPESKPTHSVTQSGDSYPLVSASFAYPPFKPDTNPASGASSGTSLIAEKPLSQGAIPADIGQNKYQSWKPMQDVVVQQSQTHNEASGTLPQISVLQNQNSELGDFDQKNSGNPESLKPGNIPSTLVPPSDPRKPTSTEGSFTADPENSSIPAALQPAHQSSNQQSIPGTGARHESISVVVAAHNLSYAPSVLKPGGHRPNNGLPESQGSQEVLSPHAPNQITQGTVSPHRPSEQGVQGSSNQDGGLSITRVNTLPDHLSSVNVSSPPKMNGPPGFLVFHEISSTPNLSNHGSTIHAEELSPKPTEQATTPHSSGSSYANPQSSISNGETFPVIAPSSFVKRHSSKSSVVSSISPDTQDSSLASGRPASTPPDEIFEVMSVVSSFTPQGTPAPSSGPSRPPTHAVPEHINKPSPTSMGEGVGSRPNIAAGARPQATNEQSPLPAMNIQQAGTASKISDQGSHASVNNTFKPTSATATQMTQTNAILSPGNVGIATTQAAPNTHTTPNSSSATQGSAIQYQNPSPSLSQHGNPGKVSASLGPLRPQGSPSNPFPPQVSAATTSTLPSSQTNNTTHINQAQQPVAHNNLNHNMSNTAQHRPQAQQVNTNTVNANSSNQNPVTASSVSQGPHQNHEQNNISLQSTVGSSAVGYPQASTPRPNLQHTATTVLSSQQPTGQPPVGYQVPSSAPAQISPQHPHQHSSPVAQPVSPLQSQVSSPAQSIASLHVSQSSTPSIAFANMNNTTSPNVGSNVNINQATPVSAYAHTQQTGNSKPPSSHPSPLSPTGNVQTQPSSQPKPPVQPYPMLPGQVTPLPSQIGSAPVQLSGQQAMPHNPPKPTSNVQQAAVGQQAMQTTSGGMTQHHVLPSHSSQVNQIPNSGQGTVTYGQASSQAQIKPPQQQTHTFHPGTNHSGGLQPMANHPQPQQMAFHPSPPAPGQAHNPQTMLPPSAGSPPVASQQTFPSPQTAQAQAQQFVQSPGVNSPVAPTPGRPFNSAQATAALTDAGKGMKKWAKKMLKNPGIKQTTFAIGGAVVAESLGVNAAAGAQLANSVYASAHRPQLPHAQTAPPQTHGIPGAVPQQQSMQVGQQYQPGKPQPMHPQPNHQPVHPQPGRPQSGHPQQGQLQPGRPQQAHPQQAHPQPGYPQQGHVQQGHPQQGHPQQAHPQQAHPQQGHPQQGHPQQGHPQQGHPQQGHPQQGHPQQAHPQQAHPQQAHPQQGHPQQGHPQQGQPQQGQLRPGRPQPGHPQPGQQPVGTQPPSRPPVAQNPALATGVSVSFNGQAQAQIGFNQQQQYPMVRPAMVGNQPPPGTVSVQAPGIQGQAQVNVDPNMTAVLIGSAVGAALRPDHPQQSQGGRAQGYAQPDHNSHAESYGAENHGYSTENHAGAHEPAHDSYYTAQAPTTYTDNNNMAADTTYADSTSHSMNNATYVDNTDVTVVNNTYVNNTDVAVNNSTYADNSMYVNTDTTYTDTSYVDTTAYGSTDTTYVDASYYDSTAYGTTEVTVDMNVESYTDGNTTTFSMEESINVASSSDFGVTSGDYSGGGWGDWFSE